MRPRTEAVKITTSTQTSSATAPNRHTMSSHDGTASIRPTTACSNPDGGMATNDSPRSGRTVATSVKTSDALRSLDESRADEKNGAPLRRGVRPSFRVAPGTVRRYPQVGPRRATVTSSTPIRPRLLD